MSHPEVPPDHTRFTQLKDGQWFFRCNRGDNGIGQQHFEDAPIDQLAEYDAEDCAAHAFQYWLMKFDELRNGSFNDCAKAGEMFATAKYWTLWGKKRGEEAFSARR